MWPCGYLVLARLCGPGSCDFAALSSGANLNGGMVDCGLRISVIDYQHLLDSWDGWTWFFTITAIVETAERPPRQPLRLSRTIAIGRASHISWPTWHPSGWAGWTMSSGGPSQGATCCLISSSLASQLMENTDNNDNLPVFNLVDLSRPKTRHQVLKVSQTRYRYTR